MNREQAKVVVDQWETRGDEIICDHNGELRLSVPPGVIVASLPMADGSIVQRSYAGPSWITEELYTRAKKLLSVSERTETRKSDTSVPVEGSPVAKEGRQERQIKKIIQIAEGMGYDLMAIPEGGKKMIKQACLKDRSLFTVNGFLKAWKEASKQGRLSIANKNKYL